MKQSVEGERILEETRKGQNRKGRQEVKDSTSSSDEKGDCIGVLSKKV